MLFAALCGGQLLGGRPCCAFSGAACIGAGVMVGLGMSGMQALVGCDFSSAPSKRKQIVLAWGCMEQGRVRLTELQRLVSLDAFSTWLQAPQSWVGGFDLPFGLPRELVQALGWPTDWEPCMRHYASLERSEIRDCFAAFCKARPAGGKFAHRATDVPARSSPSMKWVSPPVAFMLHAGVPRLLDGVYLPVCSPRLPLPANGPGSKVALEAYPGLLARSAVRSYKDDPAKQNADRLIALQGPRHRTGDGPDAPAPASQAEPCTTRRGD